MGEVAGRVVLGLVFSLLIGGLGYWRGWLTRGGVVGAVLLGTVIFGLGGWVWAGVLVAFFASSSLLSLYGRAAKAALAGRVAKGSRRDLAQTLANGGLAALLALAVGITGKEWRFYPVLAFAFYGALAAVNADTWASELGVLARQAPRLITNGRPVAPGSSGGVTRQGTLAAGAGALFLGLATFILIQGAALATLHHWLLSDWIVIPVATVSGFAGAMADSLLGATVQAGYMCDRCGIETEQTIHRCGQATRLVRGWSWLDNDGVNFLASLVGALAGGLAAAVLFL